MTRPQRVRRPPTRCGLASTGIARSVLTGAVPTLILHRISALRTSADRVVLGGPALREVLLKISGMRATDVGSGGLARASLATEGVAEVDPFAPAPSGRDVEVSTRFGSVRLHVREAPGPHDRAETAVHLHGLAGSSTNWTDLAGMLGGRVRSLAIDLPGFGETEPPAGFDFSRRAHAHVVLRFLDELDAGPVHLFGNSFGGALAVEIAARRPDLVATLTLISPAVPDLRPDPRRLSDQRIAWSLLPLIGPVLRRRLAAVSARERAERLIRLCFAEPAAVPPHRVNEAVAEFRARAVLPWAAAALARTTGGLIKSWLRPRSESLLRLLRQVRAPALVVWGDQDRVISVRKAVPTAKALKHARLLVLPNTGHVAHMERPSAVARAAVAMLDETRDRT